MESLLRKAPSMKTVVDGCAREADLEQTAAAFIEGTHLFRVFRPDYRYRARMRRMTNGSSWPPGGG
jgi:hypothetical protein